MPKLKPDEIVASIIAGDKAMRETIRFHKNLIKMYDADVEQETREFEERQARLRVSLESNVTYHDERLAKIERRKEAVTAIILKLEGELAEDVEVEPEGITTLPAIIVHEPERARPAKKGRFARMLKAVT